MSTLKATNLQNASSATTNAVLNTDGTITTGTNMTVTGTAVMSSPYTMRNKIINGAMVIDQRNAGASVTPTANAYTLDRWYYYCGGVASKASVQRNAGSVTPPAGFSNYAGLTSTSAYTVSATDRFGFQQGIEGFNTADLAWGTSSAKTVTLSFWVYSSLTGTFGGILQNDAGTQFYVFSYTITAANTWQQKTITIPGSTTGVWRTDNGGGVFVSFSIGAGSTYLGTAGSWGSTLYFGPTGQTSIVGTNGAVWYVTGVQLEQGTIATPFEYRNYQQELAMCQRYFYSENSALQLSSSSTGSSITGTFQFPVTMRTNPTVTNNFTNANYNTAAPAGTFKFNHPYVGDATKTGTLSVAQNSLPYKCVVYWYGATFSLQPTNMDVNSLPILFSAEL